MRKIPFILFSITFFYLLSNFLAPLMLEPGTVNDMDANANRVDYWDKWKDMMSEGHVYEGIIYLFGDINCHQKHTRTYTINGNQMPICTRDVGIFLGGSVGFLILFLATPKLDFYQTFFSVLPSKFQERLFKRVSRKQLFFLILVMAVVPTGFDGIYQLASDYESTNFTRIVTGFIFGIPTALAFGAFLMAGVHDEYHFPDGEWNVKNSTNRQTSVSSSSFLSSTSPASTTSSPCDESEETPIMKENTLIEKEGNDNGGKDRIERQKDHNSAEP